jgi:hypothetical protein
VIESKRELHVWIALSSGTIVENQSTRAFIAGTAGDSLGAVVHCEGISSFDGVGLFLGNDRGEEIVF